MRYNHVEEVMRRLKMSYTMAHIQEDFKLGQFTEEEAATAFLLVLKDSGDLKEEQKQALIDFKKTMADYEKRREAYAKRVEKTRAAAEKKTKPS